MDKVSVLTSFEHYINSYSKVSKDAFMLIDPITELIQVDKNQVLLPMGAVAHSIYYIYKGAVIAFYSDAKGGTYSKNIFLENQLAASTVSSLLREPSEFTLQAIEDTVLLKIDFLNYKQLIFENEQWKNYYIAYLEKNWVIEKEEREVSIVMEQASIRYRKLIAQYPNIHLRVPLIYIASNLGITPTQLSRIRKKNKVI